MKEIDEKLEKKIEEQKNKNNVAFNVQSGYERPVIKPKVLNVISDDKNEILDIDYGYLDSICISDNRPYHIECWGIADVIMVSVYLSSKDKLDCSREELIKYLEENNVVIWLNKLNKKIQVNKGKDEVGTDILTINVKLKEEDTNFAKIVGSLHFYNPRNKLK